MAKRQRLTWDTVASKEAAAPPQIPAIDRTESAVHPGAKKDPEIGDYDHRDPSAWLDVVKEGKPPRGQAPALPGVEPKDHPASSKQAAQLREAGERADKCIMIAKQALARDNFASAEDYENAVTEQAYSFMHMASEDIDATLSRLGLVVEDTSKEASTDRIAALEDRFASLESKIDQLLNRQANLFTADLDVEACDHDMMGMGMHDMMGMDDDMGLEEMLAADDHGRDMSDPEYGFDHMASEDAEAARMLEDMLSEMRTASEEDDDGDDDGDKEANPGLQMMLKKKKKKASEEGDDDTEGDDEDEKEGSKKASEEGDDDAEGDDEDEKEGSKKASDEGETSKEAAFESDDDDSFFTNDPDLDPMRLASTQEVAPEVDHTTDPLELLMREAKAQPRPQPKKQSNGIQQLGTVVKEASTNGGVSLEDLWTSEPDVSAYFTPRS